jgi:hypothetical protein
VVVSKQLPFLFSGSPVITGPSSGFQIADSGQYSFTFKVADANGNPLSQGTTIAVTASGAGSGSLSLKGDAARTLPDTKDTAFTSFGVLVQDNSGAPGQVMLTITVAGDNGTSSRSWTGTKLAKGAVLGGGGAGYVSSIQSLTVTPASPGPISVKGTGSGETASMVFQVKDSLGNPLDPTRAADISFVIQNGPGGGEFLYPASATTNSNGQVTTTLNAGTKAGVVQVLATTTLGSVTISSSPVQMVIASGLADPNHFSVWTSTQVTNIPVSAKNMFQQPVATIDVLAADQYGNPAQNTAVYFTSNGGVIAPSAKTNAEGSAKVTLLGGLPAPPGGVDTVTVSSAGANGQSIVRRLLFKASGDAAISIPAYPSGNLPSLADGGYLFFGFDLKDANNNPLAAGNAINVSVSGDQTVTSQLLMSINGVGTQLTTLDTQDTASVHYQLKIADNVPNGGTGGSFIVTLVANGPNGTVTKTLNGFLQAPGVISGGGGGGGGTGYISSIILSSVSSTDISVQGTGNTETATLVFQAKDSLGQVVDQPHGSMMHFVISPPTLGATLTIDSMQTDASGRATTLIRSGTRAGVIQIKATATVPSGQTIASLPVRLSINSGLPDQNHFSIAPARYNFPGLRFNGLTDAITIQMGDAYGNPVQTGTVAYFTTNHGVIQTTGSTSSSDGFITKTLFSGNPRPEGAFAISDGNGYSYVTASTYAADGSVVHDSIQILWTGPPIITRTGGFAGFSIPKGGVMGPWTFTVQDQYNHPMSAGTSITVSADAGTVSGNTGTMADTKASGPGRTSFSVMVANNHAAAGTDPPVASQIMVTVNHSVYGVFTLILDVGTMQ